MASHVFLHVPDDELRVYRYISLGGYHPMQLDGLGLLYLASTYSPGVLRAH